jgi:isochorismate synthase EntC
MSTLQSIPSEDMPKGMIPIFFRPLTQASMREFAIDCMEKFATNEKEYIVKDQDLVNCIKDDKRQTRDPMDNFIVHGIILPMMRVGLIADPTTQLDAEGIAGIYIYNSSLCLKSTAANKLKSSLASYPPKGDQKTIRELSTRALGAQYDAFMDSWSRVVGVALTPAKNGDLTKVLFRP